MAGLNDGAENTPVIIRIVRKKKGGGGHHGGAWKVAYADFVTAMMAFFLVMWIVGLSKPVRQAIAAYFRDPSGFMKTSQGGKHPLAGGSAPAMTNNKPAPLIPKDGGDVKSAATQADFKAVAAAVVKMLEKRPEFQGLRDSIQVRLTDEGLRIELMEKTSSLFFAPGSAKLEPRTIGLLQAIARELRPLKNPVIMEGHTDSRPLNGPGGYSNWELSTDRANSARKAMEKDGLHPGQIIAVRGYADRKLLRPSEPMHFSNRRVSILVAYTAKGQ